VALPVSFYRCPMPLLVCIGRFIAHHERFIGGHPCNYGHHATPVHTTWRRCQNILNIANIANIWNIPTPSPWSLVA